jgi:hypothetical protein
MTKAKAATLENPAQKYEIIDYAELPVSHVTHNPRNPRPSFHLEDDDPELAAMADSIKVEGQHRPVLAFELIGHYEYPDKPGFFMLLQGERRWRSCNIAEVENIKTNIIRTPKNLVEELELLGIEEAHKLPWQPFFEMQHAKTLADAYGITVRHANIANKTGLTLDQLRQAEKIFALEPEIQQMLAEYEKEMYLQRIQGKRKKSGRITGRGVRVNEFTITKAATVYEIFLALRENLTLTVAEFNDLDLQKRIATWATAYGTSTDDLSLFLQALRQVGTNPPPGMIAKVHNLVQNPDAGVKLMVNTMGNGLLNRLNNLSGRAEKLGKDSRVLSGRAEQFGHDEEILGRIQKQLMVASREIDRLERAVADRISFLEKRA